jgi:hypothetical protein
VDVLRCFESLIKKAIRSQAYHLSCAVSESRILVIGAGGLNRDCLVKALAVFRSATLYLLDYANTEEIRDSSRRRGIEHHR